MKTKQCNKQTCLQIIVLFNRTPNTRCKQKYNNKHQLRINEAIMFTVTFIEISRSHEHYPSRTFIRLFTLPYKKQRKAGD